MKTVVVLGCYRSATSLIAKGLHLAGVHMGDALIEPSSGNPWGHWEDRDFVNLSDAILQRAGGTWNKPPTVEAINDVSDYFSDRVQSLLHGKAELAHRAGRLAWGWKDPRTVLTFSVFRPHLVDPVLVVVRRNFPDIVDSLVRRDGADIEAVRDLTHVYLDRLTAIAAAEDVTIHAS